MGNIKMNIIKTTAFLSPFPALFPNPLLIPSGTGGWECYGQYTAFCLCYWCTQCRKLLFFEFSYSKCLYQAWKNTSSFHVGKYSQVNLSVWNWVVSFIITIHNFPFFSTRPDMCSCFYLYSSCHILHVDMISKNCKWLPSWIFTES